MVDKESRYKPGPGTYFKRASSTGGEERYIDDWDINKG
jgi:hypothetical protein